MKIQKFISFFFLFALLQLSCHAQDLYFNSIQEVLDFETAQIVDLGSADSYINRAESYLLCQKYELALVDLEAGYKLAQNRDDNPVLHFRSLFGLAIVYANIDELDQFHAVVDSIKEFLDAHKCTGCLEKHTTLCSHYEIISEKLSENLSDQPILGPDRISIEECIKRAQGTANYAKIIIGFSKPQAQFILNTLIDDLTSQAIKCCMAGGLWKTCIQPLVNKCYQWDEKWKILGIPPDPAWD